MIPLIFGN